MSKKVNFLQYKKTTYQIFQNEIDHSNGKKDIMSQEPDKYNIAHKDPTFKTAFLLDQSFLDSKEIRTNKIQDERIKVDSSDSDIFGTCKYTRKQAKSLLRIAG